MSLILKSNNAASNVLGTLKTIGTNPDAEYLAYKSRVQADGGVIRDEARTKRAFNELFRLGIYGNLAYFIAGFAGVKLGADNTVTKAYSLDGSDLLGVSQGGGKLPTISGGNFFDFSANSPDINNVGGSLSLESYIKVAEVNQFATFFSTPAWGSGSVSSTILSMNATFGNTDNTVDAPLVSIREGGTTGDYVLLRVLKQGSRSDAVQLSSARASSISKNNVLWVKSDKDASKTVLYRAGVLVQSNSTRIFDEYLQSPVTHAVGKSVFKTVTNYGNTPVTYAGALIHCGEGTANDLSLVSF